MAGRSSRHVELVSSAGPGSAGPHQPWAHGAQEKSRGLKGLRNCGNVPHPLESPAPSRSGCPAAGSNAISRVSWYCNWQVSSSQKALHLSRPRVCGPTPALASLGHGKKNCGLKEPRLVGTLPATPLEAQTRAGSGRHKGPVQMP